MSRHGRREGVGAFLTVARLVMGNPVARLILSIGSKEFKCVYKDKGEVNAPAIYHTLSMLAGESVECPISVRFLGIFINLLANLGVSAMGGRKEDVVEAVKDPALRRGISLVFRGLAEYGVTVPQRLPAPFLIVWNFTNMCNLRCKHCYQRADKPLPDELSLAEKLELVEQLDRAGVAAIALSGGEPTIHPDFLTVVKAIASRGIYAAVATNGWRLADPDFFKKAVDAGLRYIEVSVDSADPKKHDKFRGVEGSWERAIKALENAVKYNLSHAMAATITKYNIDEVEEIIDLAQSIGVKRLVFFNFIPVGRGVEISDLDLSPEEREEFM
ncbi:MAG: radical SAM/SPASM domain-containing protein, partial [Thermoplasmata archaeon]